jgi:hypothetical protein
MNYVRNRIAAVIVVGIAVGCAEGGASTPPARSAVAPSAESAAEAPRSESKRVIADRPAVYALPAKCGPAGRKFQCNPVTNEGCDSAKDEACDDDEHDGFGCYPGPNAVMEGGECNDEEGPSCHGGFGCDTPESHPDGICRRYCCADGDCGAKKCVAIDKDFGTLGFCK